MQCCSRSSVLEACAIGGIRVPDDVAVVGIDEDLLLSELSNPPLSSVVWNADQCGYLAAELLHEMMLGRVKEKHLILVEPLRVAARLSSDVIVAENRDVSVAAAFIRDNARRPIGVQDVVKHCATSRRTLEVCFQHSLGRSIREEIERVRINSAKQLLAETDLSATKIARSSGFNSQSYLSKVFRRVVGMTMARYRRDYRNR